MYISEIFRQWRARKHTQTAASGGAVGVPVTVYALGGTSLLTDVSTEMVASILPVYLMVAMRLSPAEYGVVDGIFRGGAAVAALLLGAFLTYDIRRAKLIAGIGYALSALTKIILLASGAFAAIGVSLVLDRLGKGLRVAPRDAMLASAVAPGQLGVAFGVHRAMDGLGAVCGPLLAVLILWYWPSGYHTVFGVALAAAIGGLLVFALFVRPKPGSAARVVPGAQGWRANVARALPAPCRRLLGFAMLLTLFTVSEGMVYGHMQRTFTLEPYMQPLLPVGAATAFLLLAVPMGWLADRIGTLRVFCAAHLLLLPLYILLAFSGEQLDSLLVAGGLVLLIGAFLAATDGVLMAAVARAVPPNSRGMSLGLFAAGLASMKLASSSLFGYLWDRFDIAYALIIFGTGLVIGLLAFVAVNPLRALVAAKGAVDPS